MSGGLLGAPGPYRVAADLLLLSVGERATWLTRGPVAVVVAAGSLADDVLSGHPAPGRTVTEVAAVLRAQSTARTAQVQQRAEAVGAVAPELHRVLGLFPRHGLRLLDIAARDRAWSLVQDGLRPGFVPSPATAVLTALASVSGLVRRQVALAPTDRRAYATHLNSLAVATGPQLALVVAAARRELRRSGSGGDSAPVLFVPPDDRDGYGDDQGGDGSGSDGGGGGDGDGGGGDGGGD